MNSKSCRSFVFCIVVSLTFLIESCVSASLEEEKDEDYLNELTEEDEERFLIIPAISINASALSSYLPIALALAASVASLLATVALAAIVFSVFGKYKHDGYGSYSGYGNTGGYTSYNSASSYRSLFDPSMIDWEKFSILDLIKTGEEIWSQFNPSDVECQKRLICEIHQNSGDLGSTAEQIVDLFSYLSYTKVMTLPSKFQKVVNDYLEAADKGLEENVDCGDEFFGCKYSLKKMAKKYKSKKEKQG